MTIASPTATFSLPEASRGIYAAAGGLPRLVHTVGLPLATEIALTGRILTAPEALEYKLINRISKTPESLIEEAIEFAKMIEEISPDAVIVSRAGLRQAYKTADVEAATREIEEVYNEKLQAGENRVEGLMAFKEKRKPVWVPSKL